MHGTGVVVVVVVVVVVGSGSSVVVVSGKLASISPPGSQALGAA